MPLKKCIEKYLNKLFLFRRFAIKIGKLKMPQTFGAKQKAPPSPQAGGGTSSFQPQAIALAMV
jgi:hypothetical protein